MVKDEKEMQKDKQKLPGNSEKRQDSVPGGGLVSMKWQKGQVASVTFTAQKHSSVTLLCNGQRQKLTFSQDRKGNSRMTRSLSFL